MDSQCQEVQFEYEMVDSQRGESGIIVLLKTPKLQYLSSPDVFVDAYRLRYLWSMVYELIFHCLLTNQNSGIAIYQLLVLNNYHEGVFYHASKHREKS